MRRDDSESEDLINTNATTTDFSIHTTTSAHASFGPGVATGYTIANGTPGTFHRS